MVSFSFTCRDGQRPRVRKVEGRVRVQGQSRDEGFFESWNASIGGHTVGESLLTLERCLAEDVCAWNRRWDVWCRLL